jgi:hypothetical protein
MHVELRVTGSKLGWLIFLKAAWIAATLVALLIGLGTCLAGEEPCFQAGESMEPLMFFISFPSSVLYFVWSPEIFGWYTIHAPFDYFLFWLGAFVVGYVQWFVAIPRLFGTPLITSLNLAGGTRSKTRSNRRRRARRVRILETNKVKPFDAEGKTPIERVFSAHAHIE